MSYVLVNIAHSARRPSAPRAAFRILGLFSSADEASMHARNLLVSDVDMHLAEVGKFFALMREAEQDEGKHLRSVYEAYKQRLKSHEEDFRENVEQQRTGQVSDLSLPTSAEADVSRLFSGDAPSAVPRGAELRLQNFAVVSVMQDHQEPDPDRQQPCVVVWGAYDTEEQAKEAVRKQLSLTVTDLHLEVVQLYEWLHPTEVGKHLDELVEEFRDEKLTEIISTRKEEARKVKAFRQSCGDREAPLIDFTQPEVRVSGPEVPGELTA